MAKKPTYDDRVLISLKRTYSKDETVLALSKKLSAVELELGKATAYIQELEYEKSIGGGKWKDKYRNLKERFDKLETEMKSSEVGKKNAKLNSEVKKLRKLNSDLIGRIVQLEIK